MRRILAAIVTFFVLLLPVFAQDEDDGTRLERWIQDSLSQAGRTVRISGFSGALSSSAKLSQMTIADDDGVWLILSDAQLDWSRAALLQGRLELDALTADRLEITRKPNAQGVSAEDAEATPFALPELPVSINVGAFGIETVAVSEDILGQAAEWNINGSANLSGGSGSANLQITRIDGPRDEFQLEAAFSNDSNVLSLDMSLVEEQGGLVSTVMNLPGQPPLDLTLQGTGPLSDFEAQMSLKAADTTVVEGMFQTQLSENAAREFAADLKGDFSQFFSAQYQPFFGSASALDFVARSDADGAFFVEQFLLATRVLQMQGTMDLSPNGLPTKFDITGTMQDSEPILLPLSGPETYVTGAQLTAQFDAAQSDRWVADIRVQNLRRDSVSVAEASLAGQGQIALTEPYAVTARVVKNIQGLALDDPALAQAVGNQLQGSSTLEWAQDGPLVMTALDVTGETASVTGSGRLEGGVVFADVDLSVELLSRFAALTGQELSGAMTAGLSAQYEPLSGAFDAQLAAQTQDLAIGQTQADALLAGVGQLVLDAVRDETGTTLRSLNIVTDHVLAQGAAQLDSKAGVFDFAAELNDVSVLELGLTGQAEAQVQANWEATTNTVFHNLAMTVSDAEITGNGALDLSQEVPVFTGTGSLSSSDLSVFSTIASRPLRGRVEAAFSGTAATDLSAADASVQVTGQNLALGIEAVDQLLEGRSDLNLEGLWDGQALTLRGLDLSTPQLSAQANGALDQQLDVSARLRDLGLFVPEIPGAATVTGQIRDDGQTYAVSLDVTGPANITSAVNGSVAKSGDSANLAMQGRAPLGLANPFIEPRSASGVAQFDLALDGPLELASLSGRFSTETARVSVPDIQTALEEIEATGRISEGGVDLVLRGDIATGGSIRLRGPIQISPTVSSNLELRLDDVVLRDPELYETEIDGDLTIRGPLPGGRIAGDLSLDATEVQVPSSGLSVTGDIPEGLIHIGEGTAARLTRSRAGLIATEDTDQPSAPFDLNVNIDVPNRIFIRGRGLDAELGGSLNIGGTTVDVVPSGQFELVRGRIDVLGQRLTLSEGSVSIQGSLDPYLRLVAETQTTDYTVRAIIEGVISDPEIVFESDPSLPEDEVLSQLLFGRSLDTLSPFQAAQLAASVATLAGRNEGLVTRLRKSLDLDDLDITSDDDGETSVRAGKYISDRVYTDVTVGSSGDTSVNLNIDLLPNVTATGGASTGGEANLGLFWQRDY